MEAVVHAHNSKWPQAALVLLLISIVFQQQYSLLTCPPHIALYSLYSRNCNRGSHRVSAAAMNELTWRRVLEWEALHHDTCGDPKLMRFLGKPHDLRQVLSLQMACYNHAWKKDRLHFC